MAGKLTAAIDELAVNEGFQAGRHYPPMAGYWAAFGPIWRDDDTLEPECPGSWGEVGHGGTLDEAASEAWDIYNEVQSGSYRTADEFGAIYY